IYTTVSAGRSAFRCLGGYTAWRASVRGRGNTSRRPFLSGSCSRRTMILKGLTMAHETLSGDGAGLGRGRIRKAGGPAVAPLGLTLVLAHGTPAQVPSSSPTGRLPGTIPNGYVQAPAQPVPQPPKPDDATLPAPRKAPGLGEMHPRLQG